MQPLFFSGAGNRCVRCFGLLVLLATAAGCGGQGQVSGRVLLNGNPLPGGTLTFRPVDSTQPPTIVFIDKEGRYDATVSAGECQIMVDNRELEPTKGKGDIVKKGGLPPGLPPLQPSELPKVEDPSPAPSKLIPEKREGNYVPIPSKYYDISSSGLSYKVTPGAQTHDVELSGEGK